MERDSSSRLFVFGQGRRACGQTGCGGGLLPQQYQWVSG
jgi:hypothetical protein